MIDRDTMDWYGARGWVPVEGLSYERAQLGRETVVAPHLTLDPNPYRLLPREGSRHPRFPKLRLQVAQVQEYAGISFGTFRYVDARTFGEAKAGRYPRGLIDVAESLQQTSTEAILSLTIVPVTVTYRAIQRVYRSYSGVDPDMTIAATAPPFSPVASIIEINFPDVASLTAQFLKGTRESRMAEVRHRIMSAARFDWQVSRRASFQGDYWLMDETWVTKMVQESIDVGTN